MAVGTRGTRSDTNRLVVMPLLWSREVFVVPPGRPHCFVRHLSLEAFSCRNSRQVPAANMGSWAVDHQWEWKEDGTFGCTGTVAEGVTYLLDLTPQPDLLDVRVTVNNRSTITLEDLYAVMCLDVRRNTLMYDPSLNRTYVEVGGRLVSMSKTDLAKSYGGVMPTYFSRGTMAENRWIPEAMATYGWAISSMEIDSPIVAICSSDGTWTTGEWFCPCHHITGNCKQPFHDCIHSEPAFGTLGPGKSAAAVGRLYLSKGSLEKVWSRMADDWRQARELGRPSKD